MVKGFMGQQIFNYIKQTELRLYMKKNKIIILQWLSLALCLYAHGSQAQYQLEASFNNANASVYLNGFPVSELSSDASGSVSKIVNQYLKQGKNTVSIMVKSSSDLMDLRLKVADLSSNLTELKISSASIGENTYTCDVSLKLDSGYYSYAAKSNSNSSKFNFGLDGSYTHVPSHTEAYSHLISLEYCFNIHDIAISSLPWQQDINEYKNRDYDALSNVFDDFNNAFNSRDIDQVLELYRNKNERYAIAFGRDYKSMSESCEKFFSKYYESNNYSFKNADFSEIHIVDYEGLNLIKLIKDDGKPPFYIESDHGSLAVIPYFSLINGDWILVD